MVLKTFEAIIKDLRMLMPTLTKSKGKPNLSY